MKSLSIYNLSIFILLLSSCANLDDAELTDRKTFMRFYESANSMIASSAEVTSDGGYVICGSLVVEGDVRMRKMLVIKVDRFGQRQWEKRIDGGSANSIAETENAFIVVGDSLDPNITPVKSSARLVILNKSDGSLVNNNDICFNNDNNPETTGYHTTAVSLSQPDTVITLGTHINSNGQITSDVTALDATSFDTLWSKSFAYINRDYSNTKKVFYADGSILWGASITNNSGTQSYLGIPHILVESGFINNDFIGENDLQYSWNLNDLQKSSSGYVAVGTYSESGGSNSNIFFLRISKNGKINDTGAAFYDGILSERNDLLENGNNSSIEDTGNAIIQTSDGNYVIAGSIQTNIEKGNGGRDIWLIKIRPDGSPIWNKVIGGKSSEIVSSIREGANGELIICGTIQDGTVQSGGLASIFLFKTSANGEFKN